jgi:hypothetical protein
MKFLAFYGTRKFITAFARARHLSLSWVRLVQSMPRHPTSQRSILILSSHLRQGLSSGLLPSAFPTKALYARCDLSVLINDGINRKDYVAYVIYEFMKMEGRLSFSDRGNTSARRRHVPVPLSSRHIPHKLDWKWKRSSRVEWGEVGFTFGVTKLNMCVMSPFVMWNGASWGCERSWWLCHVCCID